MSDLNRSDRSESAANTHDVPSGVDQKPNAKSYLPLWFLLTFALVVACGVLTK